LPCVVIGSSAHARASLAVWNRSAGPGGAAGQRLIWSRFPGPDPFYDRVHCQSGPGGLVCCTRPRPMPDAACSIDSPPA
jgi:hypothetical protein